MNAVTCYTEYLAPGEERKLSFHEILLDERWADGVIECDDMVYAKVGDVNRRLKAKQKYEFLLRAAKLYEVKAVGMDVEIRSIQVSEENEKADWKWEAYRTDCYIVGKYQKEALESGYFEAIIKNMLIEASSLPNRQEAEDLLEKMISHAPEYYYIDDNTAPFLIYQGTNICYNVLKLLGNELQCALNRCRQRVEIFDVDKEDAQALTKYIGQHFRAVIGIQSCLFTTLMQDNATYLHDLIVGPKFNIILDHPAGLREIMTCGPKDYFFLIHDRNYINYVKKYYSNIAECIYFPGAGALPRGGGYEDRCYKVSFIGTYNNYRDCLKRFYKLERRLRFLAAKFVGMMRKHPNDTGEEALGKTLKYCHMSIQEDEFEELFYKLRECCYCMMYYYREKIVETLLQAGIELHVWSETWKNAPYGTNSRLICHPALDVVSCLRVMQQSAVSLNVMSWHKDGVTERVVNAMLCKSAVVSDWSSGLEEQFVNGKDLVIFSLERLDELPVIVNKLLADEDKRKSIAQSGYEKAAAGHLWINRVRLLLDFLDKETKAE